MGILGPIGVFCTNKDRCFGICRTFISLLHVRLVEETFIFTINQMKINVYKVLLKCIGVALNRTETFINKSIGEIYSRENLFAEEATYFSTNDLMIFICSTAGNIYPDLKYQLF